MEKFIVYIKMEYPKKINIVFLILFLFTGTVFSTVRLPKLISDRMVLQRDTKVNVWGWSDPSEKILISIDGQNYHVLADKQGGWKLTLSPHRAGGPFTMILEGNNHLQINNILFGDVWLCSGQSNMELPISRVKPLYEAEIQKASNSNIRCFTVPQKYNFKKTESDYTRGNWLEVNPVSILNFSAVAYFFANELYQKYQVPIGLINASLGGSPAQAWLSEEALKAFPDYLNEGLKFRDDNLIREIEAADNQRSNDWYAEANRNDAGQQPVSWKLPELDDSDWFSTNIPGYWDETQIGNVNGVVWFRKEFILSPKNTGKPAFLNLGRIVDADSVFINGIFIGTVSYQYPPRWYHVPANVLTKGKNVIVVRVISNSGKGGFIKDKPYELKIDSEVIDLKGVWKMKLGCTMPLLQGQTFIRWKPMGLYNAMIAPLADYTKKGIVWYQGESNCDKPEEYRHLLPALINDWRTHFGQLNLPFLYAQLPNFMEPKPQPSESNWAQLRESQLLTLSVPNTGMAVTIDAGEWNDIHPLNKKVVGVRLAKLAQQLAYKNRTIGPSAPKYKSMKIKGAQIELTFSKPGCQLATIQDEKLKCIAIAGNDKKFVWAETKIKGTKIVVWSDKVLHPVAVRYAWADNPEGANLMDADSNFVSPFRTDNW